MHLERYLARLFLFRVLQARTTTRREPLRLPPINPIHLDQMLDSNELKFMLQFNLILVFNSGHLSNIRKQNHKRNTNNIELPPKKKREKTTHLLITYPRQS